jgi:hypothetical protein
MNDREPDLEPVPEPARQRSRRRLRPHRRRKNPALCPATKKIRYKDHHDATLALESIHLSASWATIHDQDTCRKETRAYACPDCDGWHLTSHPDSTA